MADLTIRQRIAGLLQQPRTVSSIAQELGLHRRDVDAHVQHLLRSARSAGSTVTIEPARCRSCGFTFERDRLTKPGRCPACRESRIYEPLIQVIPSG